MLASKTSKRQASIPIPQTPAAEKKVMAKFRWLNFQLKKPAIPKTADASIHFVMQLTGTVFAT